MTNQAYSRGIVAGLLALSTLATPVALAKGSSTAKVDKETETDVHDQLTTAQKAAKTEHQAAAKAAKLTEVKKKVCEQHTANIKTRTANMDERANHQLGVFDAIEQKVENFVTTKSLTVADYDTLKSNVASKRAEAVASIASMKADAEDFSCDTENPKGQLKTFLADLKVVRAELKSYRTAVRQLITAAKSSNGTESSTSNTTGGL